MKILMVLDTCYPKGDNYDVRVKKQISTLLEKGYSVHLLCFRENDQLLQETSNGLSIYRYVNVKKTLRRVLSIMVARVFFIDPDFYFSIKKILKLTQFDIIHVHDLPFAKTIIAANKSNKNTKIVLDLHENHPEAIKVWSEWQKSIFSKLDRYLFFQYKRWFKYEKTMCQSVDKIIAVVEEMRDFLIQKHCINSEKITVVSNTESENYFNKNTSKNIKKIKNNGELLFSYLGGIGPHRGLDIAIRAMQYMNNNIKLLIVGKGSRDVEEYLKKIVQDLNLSEKVIWIGWQPFDVAAGYIDISDVCIIPHKNNLHTANTIPHKLFQYMLQGKPMLVSSCPPLKRVIEDSNTGKVFEADNPNDFALKANQMAVDKALLKKMSLNCIKFGKEKYNWRHDGENLHKAYLDLMQDKN